MKRRVFGYYTSPEARAVLKTLAAQSGERMRDRIERLIMAEAKRREESLREQEVSRG